MKLFLLSNEVNSAIFELQRAFTFKKEGDPLDVQITTDMYKNEDGIRNMPVLLDLLRKCNSVEIKTGNPINWFLDELYNSLPNVKITFACSSEYPLPNTPATSHNAQTDLEKEIVLYLQNYFDNVKIGQTMTYFDIISNMNNFAQIYTI